MSAANKKKNQRPRRYNAAPLHAPHRNGLSRNDLNQQDLSQNSKIASVSQLRGRLSVAASGKTNHNQNWHQK